MGRGEGRRQPPNPSPATRRGRSLALHALPEEAPDPGRPRSPSPTPPALQHPGGRRSPAGAALSSEGETRARGAVGRGSRAHSPGRAASRSTARAATASASRAQRAGGRPAPAASVLGPRGSAASSMGRARVRGDLGPRSCSRAARARGPPPPSRPLERAPCSPVPRRAPPLRPRPVPAPRSPSPRLPPPMTTAAPRPPPRPPPPLPCAPRPPRPWALCPHRALPLASATPASLPVPSPPLCPAPRSRPRLADSVGGGAGNGVLSARPAPSGDNGEERPAGRGEEDRARCALGRGGCLCRRLYPPF